MNPYTKSTNLAWFAKITQVLPKIFHAMSVSILESSIKKLGFLKYRYVQTMLVIGIYGILAPHLPFFYHRLFYSFSLLIKDLLIWTMPATVCAFLAYTVASFEKKAVMFVSILLMFEFCSNFLSVWYGYGASSLTSGFFERITQVREYHSLEALFRLPFTKPWWWSCDKGVFLGIILGIFYRKKTHIFMAKRGAELLLTKFFSRLIPLFVLGFVSNMYHTKLLVDLTKRYGFIVIALTCFIFLYVFLIYFVAHKGQVKPTFIAIRNMLPAGIMALTSSCSLSTMPLTIEGTVKNLKDPDLAKSLIPATTNIQQIGDCIMMAFFSCFVYAQFFGHTPSFMEWLQFSIVFTLARFAVTAVIGGAIFVMLPIFEAYLGFNPEMIALILALNMIMDPVVTSSNVMANGGLCIMFERVLGRFIKPSV